MTAVSATSVATRFALAAAGWSVLVFLAALATMPQTFGYGVLWFAGVPMILTIVVFVLIALARATGSPAFPILAIVLCSLVCVGVIISFIIPAMAMLPTAALLIAASAQSISAPSKTW